MRMPRIFHLLLATVAMAAVAMPAAAAAPADQSGSGNRWIGAWGTGLQESVPDFFPGSWAPAGFDNQSVRQVIRVTTGGVALRLRLSNRYGTSPLQLTGATIGKAGTGGAVREHTVRPVTFNHALAT